jgi:hypothetical protein
MLSLLSSADSSAGEPGKAAAGAARERGPGAEPFHSRMTVRRGQSGRKANAKSTNPEKTGHT